MNLNLVFAPKDVNFVPTEYAASEVYDFMLEEVQDHVEFIEVDVAPRLVYIDEGDSFLAAVACPICKSKISTQGPHAAWVQALRQELMSNQALDLGVHRVRMPCCKQEAPVVALDFGGQAGFARFCIQLEGADLEEEQESFLLRKAGEILGCELVKIELASS